MTWSKQRYIAMAVAPIPSSFISLISSAALIAAILRSRTKLARPYRRIVFGMASYGFIHGVSLLTSTFLQPNEYMLGIGNMGTCLAQGFFLQLSSIGLPMYTTSLAVSFLCAVNYEMSNEIFAEKIEPTLHGITNMWALSTATFLLFSGSINPSDGGMCWARSYPEECKNDPEVDCIRGENAHIYGWVFFGMPIILCIVISVVIMIVMCRKVIAQENQNGSYRTAWQQNPPAVGSRRLSFQLASLFRATNDSATADQTEEPTNTYTHSRRDSTYSTILHNGRTTRAERRRQRRCRETVNQAILCITTFIVVNLIPMICYCIGQVSVIPPPFWVSLIAYIIYPLQGFLNVIVYTRPHVISFRRRNRDYSWAKAFFTVLSLGGDNDNLPSGRRRGSGVRRSSTISNVHWRESPEITTDNDRGQGSSIPVKSRSPVSGYNHVEGNDNDNNHESEIDPENVHVESDSPDLPPTCIHSTSSSVNFEELAIPSMDLPENDSMEVLGR